MEKDVKFAENNEKFKICKEICFEEIDFFDGGVLPCAVLKKFQDIALAHAKLLGVGFGDMLKLGLLWVSMRIKYEVLREPKPNEKLEIVTYPSGKNWLEFDRDYLIFDEQKNLIIKGTNKWCFIDKNTRRPAKMSVIDHIKLPEVKPVFEGRFVKNDMFEPTTAPDFSYQIKSDDIDGNNHTNNTVYAKMIESILKNERKTINFFQINFLKETLFGDRIDIYKKQNQQENNEKSLDILGKLCEAEPCFLVHIETE